MDEEKRILNLYISTLKAISLIATHCHWTVKQKTFFGDHLMFERIYKSSLENLDEAAEKVIGVFGLDNFDYDLQTSFLTKILNKYSPMKTDPISMLIAIVSDFIKLSVSLYDFLDKNKKLTLGFDDMLCAISNTSEGFLYLLKQTAE
jgi:DNA-binding ferritin-like protein